ncbi:LmbE family protein [Kitasatospora sp. MMS16-BH015]|uniref:PIG-L family deacetylase n=1 Tax=Kitasatospora sp. MMS16-BH015 TaxID=2018025 RepID=UPI000CA2BCA3|nr:PIG-L family deacetylase [Kitasatospora sp. MMS16-BH015]AUG79803.1 LmbE family protein [Kitasatospora sp. MMS16-BH015]
MGNPLTRRRALWLTGGLLAAPAAGYGIWEATRPDQAKAKGAAGPAEEHPVVGTGLAGGAADLSFVHVIAHPDDNLYFMNPDLDQAVASGAPCVTVCLTDGESDGRNILHAERREVPADRPAYTRARINGLAASYAVMATGEELSPWDVELVSYLPGLQAELHTLRAAPHVQLVFPALVEARAVSLPRAESLRGLWLGQTDRLATLPPARSKLAPGATYTREQVTATLAAVLDHYRPTVVRTLDPNPEHAPEKPGRPGGAVYLDHQDHTYSAYFAQAAAARHFAAGKGRAASVESYLGYVNAGLPHNLDAPAVARKTHLLDVYGWTDDRDCGDPAGCGDRKVGGGALRNGWAQSTRYRAPGSGEWLVLGADGVLHAFALLNGAAVWWRGGTGAAGSWRGPEKIEGDGLEGQLQVVKQASGQLRLFGVRTVLEYEAGKHRREIVTCEQEDSGSGFGEWTSLGAPDGDDPVKSMEAGYPTALALADGTVQVFARNWGGSVSVRTLDDDWQALPLPPDAGPAVQDGLGVVVDGAGLSHVFAPGRTVVHWASTEPGGLLRPAGPTGLPTPGGPVSARVAEGALVVEFREPKSAKVLTARRTGQAWKVVGETAGPGGFGRVSAVEGAVAVRDGQGHVGVLSGTGGWVHGGPLMAGTPAVRRDAKGVAVVVAVGCDGKLYSAGVGGGWAPAG